jgi:hypothetical protein
MTEPKEEKCEACYGSGYINFWTDDGHISMRTCRRCDGYGYIKAKPMTNEEWFCQLTTEEKAKFIFWQHFDVYGKTLYELMVNASKGVARDKQAEVMIGAVVEWLKQPHTPKE